MLMYRLTFVVVVALSIAACGRDEPVDRPKLHIESLHPPPPDATAQGGTLASQITPKGALTEEAVIRLTADAIANRDLDALRDLAAPEQSADLWRIHHEDPAHFWSRGRLWVQDVQSGVTIAHRTEDTEGSWRVLVRFGNGREETMSFARVRGRLKIMRF